MIIWLNGTFGIGKTTTAALLSEALPSARIFDAEQVGFLLRPMLNAIPVRDFQDWPPWRSLVVDVATRALGYAGGALVVPQAVLVEPYWDEITSGLEEAGIPVHHFVLHAARATLVKRIEGDADLSASTRQWRLDHLAEYESAGAWLARKGHLIDTTNLTPVTVAARIASIVERPSPIRQSTR